MTAGRATPARPREAAEAVRLLYERIDAQDVEGLLALCSDDIVYRRPGYPALRGKAALARFYREERVIREGVHTPVRVLAHGTDVAVQGRFAGALKNGEEVQLEYAEFFTLDGDGLFEERTTFFFTPLV